MNDREYKRAIRHASEHGKECGKAQGSWFLDGNSTEETAARILKGYDDGDPAIMDICPSPLSGEYADGMTIQDILDRVDVESGNDAEDDILRAFEDGFSEGFWNEVLRSAKVYAEKVSP